MLHLQCSILEWVARLLGTIRFYQGSCLPRLTVVTAHEVSADVRTRSPGDVSASSNIQSG